LNDHSEGRQCGTHRNWLDATCGDFGLGEFVEVQILTADCKVRQESVLRASIAPILPSHSSTRQLE
jgi:hypothetical protein